MSDNPPKAKQAVHPHWVGTLVFDEATNSVALKEVGSTGKYKIDQDGILHVFWDRFPAESFREVNGTYVKMSNAESELAFMRNFTIERLTVRVPQGNANIELRLRSTDVDTFKQVFVAREYGISDLPSTCRNIIDLGANIGCAAVYFAEKYPGARIIAVEPDQDNYNLLARNMEQFGGRVSCVQAAIWDSSEQIYATAHDALGNALGAWGIRVSAGAASGGILVNAITMTELVQRLKSEDWVDVLKVDIEGAEVEIFSEKSTSWLSRVGIVVVETHDRFRPGAQQAVFSKLASDFVELRRHGENLVFRNRSYRPA